MEGEIDTEDNTFIDGSIIVAAIGDVTGPLGVPDGKVDRRDIAAIAKSYGISTGQPRYALNHDLNCDGKIDIRDIALAARNYRKIDQ